MSFERKDTLLSFDFEQIFDTSDSPEFDLQSDPEYEILNSFLSELSFLTLFLGKTKNPILLYGYPTNSSNGYHIEFLSDLFPEIEFHLYSSSFKPIHQNIIIYSEPLTSDSLKKWKDEEDRIFLISSLNGNKNNINQTIRDFNSWFDILIPVAAMAHLEDLMKVKIREGVHFLKPFTFLQNKTFYVITEKTDIVDFIETRNAIDYHYITVRQNKEFYNPFTEDEKSIFPGSSNHFDIRYMTQIFIDYLIFRGLMNYELVISLYRTMIHSLFHGIEIGTRKNVFVNSKDLLYQTFLETSSFQHSQTKKIDHNPSLISSIFSLIDFCKIPEKPIKTYLDIGSCKMDISIDLIKRYDIRNSFLVDHIDEDLFQEYYRNEMISYSINYSQFDPQNQIPFPSDSMDLITMLLYVHHRFEDLEIFIADVSRILKLGGILILQEHDISNQQTLNHIISVHNEKKYHNLSFMEKQVLEEKKERIIQVKRPRIGKLENGKLKKIVNRMKLKDILQKNKLLYTTAITSRNDMEKKYLEVYIKQ